MRQDKKFANHISDKELISRIYKESSGLNNNTIKPNDSIKNEQLT
jgi:hypothetical protein